jgi:CheY-like chemotaxis protein
MLFLPNIPADQRSAASDKIYSDSVKKILIIEDFIEIRLSLASLLRKLGHIVYLAHDGLEGWRMFRNQLFDLILTDIKMPCLFGDDLIERIKRFSPKTPVIVMTASEIDTCRMLAESGKVNFVLHKPFDVSDLLGLIELI